VYGADANQTPPAQPPSPPLAAAQLSVEAQVSPAAEAMQDVTMAADAAPPSASSTPAPVAAAAGASAVQEDIARPRSGEGDTSADEGRKRKPAPTSYPAQLQAQQPPTRFARPGSGQADPDEQQQRALKVEDALTYLDKVKTQFGDQPQVYNQFLDIMKNFKAETIDTPGVIRQVQALFRGHNNLILGFNTFLPPGCRIELSHLPPDGSEGPRPSSSQSNPPDYQPYYYAQPQAYAGHVPGYLHSQPQPGTVPHGVLFNDVLSAEQQQQMMHEQLQLQMQQQHHHQQQQQLLHQQAAHQQGQPVEFDQAISYVTKIKRRFAQDPDTYKSFLEILHTYQKEQKSIKEVLDQVSELFRDHPDLLREFTYFLPDNVRDKAKQEIARISARRQKEEQRNVIKEKKTTERKQRKRDALAAAPVPRVGGGGSKPAMSGGGAAMEEEPLHFEGHVPKLERRLFARIKSALGTRERWAEFLKCLHLFSQEVISRSELVALASDIFVSHGELLEELDRLLASRGATDNPDEDAWYSMPLSDIDFSQSRRCTPSYRALPPTYPKLPCSERTPLCRSVLNDTWVSVPTGSEDFSFKSMRKNVYEEALFKCEDDRYEFDMVIDANESAIRVLEALQVEMQADKSQSFRCVGGGGARLEPAWALTPPALPRPRMHAATAWTSARSASSTSRPSAACMARGAPRCVSSPSGSTDPAQILELLRKIPGSAIPVILTRLKQKDEEWRRQRIELNKEWKEVLERNYHKSLDHRSFYFKQNEKKALSHKTLLGEVKDAPDKVA
jgi:paired amphipathic helix protein Sin3a